MNGATSTSARFGTQPAPSLPRRTPAPNSTSIQPPPAYTTTGPTLAHVNVEPQTLRQEGQGSNDPDEVASRVLEVIAKRILCGEEHPPSPKSRPLPIPPSDYGIHLPPVYLGPSAVNDTPHLERKENGGDLNAAVARVLDLLVSRIRREEVRFDPQCLSVAAVEHRHSRPLPIPPGTAHLSTGTPDPLNQNRKGNDNDPKSNVDHILHLLANKIRSGGDKIRDASDSPRIEAKPRPPRPLPDPPPPPYSGPSSSDDSDTKSHSKEKGVHPDNVVGRILEHIASRIISGEEEEKRDSSNRSDSPRATRPLPTPPRNARPPIETRESSGGQPSLDPELNGKLVDVHALIELIKIRLDRSPTVNDEAQDVQGSATDVEENLVHANYTQSSDTSAEAQSSSTKQKKILEELLRSTTGSTSRPFPRPLIPDLTEQVTTVQRDVDFGGFAVIHRGQWTSNQGKWDVAVKLLSCVKREDDGGIRLNKRLGREIRAWHRLEHPNIVKFLGVSYHMGGHPAMIMHWYPNGNATKYLATTPCSFTTKMILIDDVAHGLIYLHSSDPPIVHGDLNGTNVLITDDGHAALSDFGLSHIIEEALGPTGLTTTTMAGSIRWQAPEVIRGDLDDGDTEKLTTASDVWAFACTAYELLTGMLPYYQHRSTGPIVLGIMRGAKPQWEDSSELCEAFDCLRDLLDCCWSFEPSDRPSMLEVLPRLLP